MLTVVVLLVELVVLALLVELVVVALLVGLVVESTTDETVEDDPAYPSLYTLSRFPAPQYSVLFPLHVILQSERPPGAIVAAF